MPSSSSGKPNPKRLTAVTESNPMVPTTRPMAPTMSPLIMDSPETVVMIRSERKIRAAISGGPIFRAIRARGGATRMSTMSLRVSPMTEE